MYSTHYSSQILMKLEFPRHFSENNLVSHVMKIRPVGTELSLAETDRHDEANSCSSQFCERAYK